MNGRVKWFDDKKGYGFIGGADGSDVFVHYTGLQGFTGRRKLNAGDDVSYDTTQGPKGVVATNVRVTRAALLPQH